MIANYLLDTEPDLTPTHGAIVTFSPMPRNDVDVSIEE